MARAWAPQPETCWAPMNPGDVTLMHPVSDFGPAVAIEITTMTTSASVVASTPERIHFSRELRVRRATVACACPGGRMSTSRV